MKALKLNVLFIVSIFILTTLSCTQGKKVTATPDKNQILQIPFEVSVANNIIFKVLLNGVDSLDLYFDSGGTGMVLRHEAIKARTSLLKGKNASYQEEDNEPLEELNTLSIGGITWDSLYIYPVGVGPLEADGHFGWDLFEDRIVELDYDKNLMTVYSSLAEIPTGYAKLKLEYINTLFCVQGNIVIDGKIFTNRYLFDTGFQRSVILDRDLRKANNFPEDLPVIKESKLRNGAGDVFINKVVNADKICFDNTCAIDIPIQLFSTPNPARFETHILGNELLKRYNTILDFQNHFVYLKPNSLMGLPYIDAS